MELKDSPIHQWIDNNRLTPVVRQAVHRETFQLQDWRVTQLGGNAGNPVSLGLYRFEGNGMDGDEPVAWSVILKILQSPANVGWQNMGEGEDQTHWNYWKRELYVYQSGLLELLPEGLAAPRCYGVEELPDNIALMWLEDIRDSMDGTWPLERYALAARHLGRLNGMFISDHSIPAIPWLSLDRNRQWVTPPAIWEAIPWDHPRVLRRYPTNGANTFRRMLLENECFLTRLDLLPRTLSHGDSYPTNFMSRRLADGSQQTVALDWALLGIQPLGDDLGQFVYGAQMNLPGIPPVQITETLFENYLNGLQEYGCQVDPMSVRFGFVTSAALRVGLFQLILMQGELGKNGNAPIEIQEPIEAPECFEVHMAKEAYRLLEAI